MPKFYDLGGVERGLSWAQGKYKVEFLDAGGGPKFKLVEVWETTGDASVNVTVRNAFGAPQYKQPVAQSWPSLESPSGDLERLPEGSSKSIWSHRAMYIYTDTMGHAGFGFGGGAVMHEDGGPLSFWIISPSTKSDGLAKVGWDGATDHTCLGHLVFELVAGDDPDPDPDPDPEPEEKVGFLCRIARFLCPKGWSPK